MRIGMMFGDVRGSLPLTETVEQVAAAAVAGFSTAWFAQALGWDALTSVALAGRVDGIEFGTAVVPTPQRHPVVLASQALTVQAATGNRLTLGIGAGISSMVSGMYGLPTDRPVQRMREYLQVLRPLLHGDPVDHQSETLTARGQVSIPAGDINGGVPDKRGVDVERASSGAGGAGAGGGGVRAPEVLVGALGVGMLRVAGEVADGAITWMTGPRTLAAHVVPTIGKAAAEAGRAAPRVVAGLAVCVTDDEASAREWFGRQYGMAGQVPEYRAMLDREGAAGPADVLIAGTEKSVARSIAQLEEAGITDFMATPVGTPQAQHRTTQTLAALLTT